MISHILQLKIDQISILIAKDFKLKYNSTALGFVWSLMMPALDHGHIVYDGPTEGSGI